MEILETPLSWTNRAATGPAPHSSSPAHHTSTLQTTTSLVAPTTYHDGDKAHESRMHEHVCQCVRVVRRWCGSRVLVQLL